MSQLDEISSGSLTTLKVTSFYIFLIYFIPQQSILMTKIAENIFKDKKKDNHIPTSQITTSC